MLKKLVIIADSDEVDENIVKNINATHKDYKIIISGIGKQCVENIKKSEYFPLIDKNTRIINIGLVGCNGVKNYNIGDVVKPKDLCKIKTVMKFESDKNKIPKDCFIDMEKSHLDTLFKNIKYIKIVSDFIDYSEYKNNLNNLKRIILQKIL